MAQINKKDIINQVAQRTGVKKELAARLVNETFTILREALCSTDSETKVGIRDFGAFEVRRSKATTARNPRTNEKIALGPRMRIHFHPGQFLKEHLKRTV